MGGNSRKDWEVEAWQEIEPDREFICAHTTQFITLKQKCETYLSRYCSSLSLYAISIAEVGRDRSGSTFRR